MQNIGKLDKNKLRKYKNKVITSQVILTDERLNEHILVKHFKEYIQLKPFLKEHP